MSKIEILKNYGGVGSRHGGAGRITLTTAKGGPLIETMKLNPMFILFS